MRGRYQGGSLAGFIIIGVVLSLVLLGGLYGLSRYNAQQAKQVATDNNGSSKKQSDKKDKEAVPESKPPTSPPSESSSNDTTKENKNQAAGEGAATNKQLPTTGPADALVSVLGIAALSYSTVHYARSRAYRSR